MPPPSGLIETEVCIVGAGPCGLVLADLLARRGRSVLVLERGGRHAGPRSHADGAFEAAEGPVGPPDSVRRFALGGSGRVWGRTLVPLDEAAFAPAPWRDLAWPFGSEHLGPAYDRALAMLDAVPGFTPAADDPAQELMVRPAWRTTRRFPLPDPLPAATRVLLGHRVARLAVSAGRAGYADVRAPRGGTIRVAAETFVLAAGAVENAMILLLSELGGDQVGRFFAEHPQVLVPTGLKRSALEGRVPDGLFHPPRASWDLSPQVRESTGLPAASAYLVPHRDPALWSRPGVLAAGSLAHALYHRDLPPRPIRTAGRALAAFADVVRVARDRSGDPQMALRVTLETPPDPESRVTLSTATDRQGLPLPRLSWRLGAAPRASLERLVAGVARRARQEGWGPPAVPADLGWPHLLTPGAHHMGTTRMSRDPARGVVDSDCRLHGASNLFMAGTSVFPTYGAANPLLTALALTLRLADHLG